MSDTRETTGKARRGPYPLGGYLLGGPDEEFTNKHALDLFQLHCQSPKVRPSPTFMSKSTPQLRAHSLPQSVPTCPLFWLSPLAWFIHASILRLLLNLYLGEIPLVGTIRAGWVSALEPGGSQWLLDGSRLEGPHMGPRQRASPHPSPGGE